MIRRCRRRTAGATIAAALALMAAPAGAGAVEQFPGGWSPPPAAYDPPPNPERHKVTVSDGTRLAASVYRPHDASGAPASGSFPVIVSISPYAKEIPGISALAAGDPTRYVTRGYIFVLADVRGTGASEGRFQLLSPREVADNVELIDWAADLPGSTGKVGMVGGSYLGFNELATAGAVGPGSPLKAIFPLRTQTDFYRDLVVPGGIFNAAFDVPYGLVLEAALNLASVAVDPELDPLGLPAKLADRIAGTLDSNVLPVIRGGLLGDDYAYDEDYWRTRSLVPYIRRIPANGVAVFAAQAWFDIWPRASAQLYSMLQNASSGRSVFDPMAPGQTPDPTFQVAVDPQTHQGNATKSLNLSLQWFETWLKGADTGIDDSSSPFHAYELLGGRWIDSPSWPPPGTRVKTLYFGPGRAGTSPLSANDGRLTAAPPRAAGSDTLGWVPLSSPCARMNEQEFLVGGFQAIGNTLGISTENPCTFDDRSQHPLSLTYTTPPRNRPATVAGPIGVDLRATSTTDQTQFVATLAVVSPDGASRPLVTGDLLGSLREVDESRSWSLDGEMIAPYHPFTRSSEQPVPVGEVVRYRFEIPGVLARIEAGERLRITLSSAMTPYLVPKLPDQQRLLGGRYQILRSPASPSAVHVPLVNPKSLQTSAVDWAPCTNDC